MIDTRDLNLKTVGLKLWKDNTMVLVLGASQVPQIGGRRVSEVI